MLFRNKKCNAVAQKAERTQHVTPENGASVYPSILGVVENVAVDVLLASLFIIQYIRGIFLAERKLKPFHSNPVAILRSPEQQGDAVTAVGESAENILLRTT